MATKVANDGEHLFKRLVKTIQKSGYASLHDDLTTTGGTIAAAIAVIRRMTNDLKKDD